MHERDAKNTKRVCGKRQKDRTLTVWAWVICCLWAIEKRTHWWLAYAIRIPITNWWTVTQISFFAADSNTNSMDKLSFISVHCNAQNIHFDLNWLNAIYNCHSSVLSTKLFMNRVAMNTHEYQKVFYEGGTNGPSIKWNKIHSMTSVKACDQWKYIICHTPCNLQTANCKTVRRMQ